MRYILLIMMILAGCGRDAADNSPLPNYITEKGLQLYIPDIPVLYNGPSHEVYERKEIETIISYWADYRANQWIEYYKYQFNEDSLWAIARVHPIEIINDWYFPCPTNPNIRCGGFYSSNGDITVAIYYSPPHNILSTDNHGLDRLPHEFEHALGLKHEQMVFP